MVFNNLYRTNLLFLTNLLTPLFKIFQSNHNLAVFPASYFLIYAFFSAAVLSYTLKKNRFAVYRFAPLSFSIYSCFLYSDNSHTAGFGFCHASSTLPPLRLFSIHRITPLCATMNISLLSSFLRISVSALTTLYCKS